MTINERHDLIIKELDARGSVSVTDLSSILNVSEVTIRKDLTMLEQKNFLYRAHGKAIKINPYINDRDVNIKEKQNIAEKIAIGKCAADMIEPNDSIIIASGTTVQFFAREVHPSGHLTVITSALNVASILSKDRNIEVIQLGGIVRGTPCRPSGATRNVCSRTSRVRSSLSAWTVWMSSTACRRRTFWRPISTAP